MREKVDYRNNLEQLNSTFPDKNTLTITEVAKYMGRDRHWVSKTYKKDFNTYGGMKLMSKVTFARILSEGA